VKLNRKEKRVMEISLIDKALREAKELGVHEVIPSTMGEPLLYKDFEFIIELCKELQFKLNLTTNGSWPIKGVEYWAEKILPIASDIKISWNGITANTQESIMLGSKLDRSIENLLYLLKKRDEIIASGINHPTITLQLTFMNSNIAEIPRLIEWAISIGIDRIKGHHLWAHFNEIQNQAIKTDSKSVRKWNLIVEESYRIANKQLLANGNKIKLEHFTQLDITLPTEVPKEAVCPFLGKEAWVNAEGDFNPCCAPDQERKSLGQFGNLYSQSLSEIWNSDAYNALKQNYLEYPLCQSCNMRKVPGC
jgi:radical SAM protein with 4Fe4S-binding SPASM domain